MKLWGHGAWKQLTCTSKVRYGGVLVLEKIWLIYPLEFCYVCSLVWKYLLFTLFSYSLPRHGQELPQTLSLGDTHAHGITPYLNGSGKGQSTSAAATIACRGGPASELDKFVEAGVMEGVFG